MLILYRLLYSQSPVSSMLPSVLSCVHASLLDIQARHHPAGKACSKSWMAACTHRLLAPPVRLWLPIVSSYSFPSSVHPHMCLSSVGVAHTPCTPSAVQSTVSPRVSKLHAVLGCLSSIHCMLCFGVCQRCPGMCVRMYSGQCTYPPWVGIAGIEWPASHGTVVG